MSYGTPEGTFLFQYLPEKKSKQKELKGNQNNNITFKPLLIFPFQNSGKEIETRILERISKQKKNISCYRLKISFIQHNTGLQLVDFFHQWEARNILIYRDIMLINRDL